MFVLLSTGAYNNVDAQQFAEYLALNRNNISKEKNGILWLEDDGTPHFLHSTFVEFFAASWILSHANTNTAKGLWCSLLDSKKGAGMKQILEHMLVEGLPLHHAVLEGREQALDELLESATVDCFGRTPLQQAASLGRADAVGALLARGFDPGRRDALLGWTALQYASASGHLQAADRLLQAGADASQLVVDDVNAALFSAADLGLKHVMIYLLNIGANVNWRKHGLTPLMISSIRGHTINVQLLLENGADLYQRSDEGQTALHFASAGCHREVMQLLLDRGAKPRVTSVDKTPLMLASEKGDALCVRLLLQYGADVHKKIHLTSALHFASENSHFEVVGILLEAGADPNDRNKRN
ncbi:hypothetical protein R5R35_011167 [Gryllus longicercus]|uniref:Uncharacterized protein n=1 Tax=Gryllus longicercus TaxID=2509291 RepID=A0AAN9VKI2_9ORTH